MSGTRDQVVILGDNWETAASIGGGNHNADALNLNLRWIANHPWIKVVTLDKFANGQVDLNNDGRLDLYVTQYPSCVGPWTSGTDTLPSVRYYPSKLYRNNGDGTFTDVTDEAGIVTEWPTIGSCWGDYDNDGRPDLFVTNVNENIAAGLAAAG